jgi:hypothetical protein
MTRAHRVEPIAELARIDQRPSAQVTAARKERHDSKHVLHLARHRTSTGHER